MDETTAKIKQFIVDEFMPDVSVDELDSDFDLLTGGVVDSLGLLQVVAWLETEFDVAVDDSAARPGELPHRRRHQDVRRGGARHGECRLRPSEALEALVTQSYPIPAEVWGDFWDRLAARELHPGEALAVVTRADLAPAGRRLGERAACARSASGTRSPIRRRSRRSTSSAPAAGPARSTSRPPRRSWRRRWARA